MGMAFRHSEGGLWDAHFLRVHLFCVLHAGRPLAYVALFNSHKNLRRVYPHFANEDPVAPRDERTP